MKKQPNILLLFSDEHSFRFMGHAEGGEPVQTPAFDKLATQSTVFTDAYCQMPLCTPSRLCMLTGSQVRESGGWANSSVLRPGLPTIPGVLGEAGYSTCLVGKMHLGGNRQFVGFQHRPYGDLTGKTGHQWEPVPIPEKGMRERTGNAVGITQIPESLIQDHVVAHETVSFLREHQSSQPEKPWFLCAGFSRPHFPLTTPSRHLSRYWPKGVTEPRVPASGDAYNHPMSTGMRNGFCSDEISHDEMMYARACYFACVSYLDEIIGELMVRLEHAGLLENTIVVYTTDHGEMAGEHGTFWKNGWYEACTRVPLIISLPEHRNGSLTPARIETPVGLLDLFPTLASLAGTACPDNLTGVDLSGVLREQHVPPDRPVFCDVLIPRWGPGTEFRMIRQGKHKYVRFRSAPPLAFDLGKDPGEQCNLLKTGKDIPPEVKALAKIAEESMDFEEAEKERTVRDASLAGEFRQNVKASTGNLYFMPDDKLINAEDTLYHPTVVAENLKDAFGDDLPQKG